MTTCNLTKRNGLVVVLVLFTLGGCFSLSRKTPVLEQYVLGSPAAEVKAAPPDQSGFTIGLRRLDLAPYLAIPAIVVRRGNQQIVTSEFHRWGEELSEGINRAFARFLAAEPSVRAVDIAPWSVRSRYDYLIQLHVLRFEGAAAKQIAVTDGEARVVARWEIIRQLDGAVLARGTTDHAERGWQLGDYGGLVTLLDKGLNAMARDLGACMARLGPVPVRPTGAEPIPAIGPALECTAQPGMAGGGAE